MARYVNIDTILNSICLTLDKAFNMVFKVWDHDTLIDGSTIDDILYNKEDNKIFTGAVYELKKQGGGIKVIKLSDGTPLQITI